MLIVDKLEQNVRWSYRRSRVSTGRSAPIRARMEERMTIFITMLQSDMERCLESRRLRQPIEINGMVELEIKPLVGIVRDVEAIPDTDPPCWRITIDESRAESAH